MILENGKIRKWDEIQGMTIEGYEKRINTEEVAGEKPVLCIIPAMTVEGAEQEKSPSIRKIIRLPWTPGAGFESHTDLAPRGRSELTLGRAPRD